MEKLIQDVRYAVRSLFRQPSFALTAILTLALGIGATTAIFTVVNAVLLRPLPFPQPDRLVAISNFWTKTGGTQLQVSAPDFHDWQAQSQSFEAMALFVGGETSVSTKGAADYAVAYRITPQYFDVLGVRAARGRLLTAEESQPGGPAAVVITDAYWKRQFNGDGGALGSTLKFNDRLFTIVGILPTGMRYPARADIYVPSWIQPQTTSRSAHNYRVIARLKRGVSLKSAGAEMETISRALEAQYPASNAGKLARVISLQEQIVGGTRDTLYILLGAVGVVLLIACANVANLLLARSTTREREMVVRAAVGATRGRLVRQLLTESTALGIVAGLLGVWFARFGVLALVTTATTSVPRIAEVRVDGTALAFAIGIALLASFLFGLAPALQVSRVHLTEGLRQGSKGTSIGARGAWARNAFVVAEVALAGVLVVSASLLARSLAAVSAVDMGFDVDRLLVLQTAFPVKSFDEAPRATAFYRDVLADVSALPGVRAASAVRGLPTIIQSNGAYAIEGQATIQTLGINSSQALFTVVAPNYFKTLEVALKQGRDFSDGDRRESNYVAIVNESLARAAFPGQDPIGRRIQCGLDTMEFMTIIGVAADIRTKGPVFAAEPEIYMPYQQHPGPSTALNIVVRTDAPDPLSLVETIQRKIRARNPDVPVRATTMEGTIETANAPARFQTYLLVLFGGIALVLALAGVYGVMAYSVSQRIPELGVRIALGATPANILRLVIGEGAKLAGAGLAIGIVLALFSGRLLEGMLFGVTARDPLIFVLVTIAVAVATLAACYIPGRRAVSVDPINALRAE